MPSIPITTPLGYLGVFFTLSGFFLLLTGTGVISIEKVSVKPGRQTLIMGIIMVLVGFLFLSPVINETFKMLSSTPTPTPTPLSIANSTPTVSFVAPAVVITETFPKVSTEPPFTPTETKQPLNIPSPTSTSLCANSLQRLQTNQYALVSTQIDSLLLRTSPGNTTSYVEKLPPQTKIFTLEEPVCADYKGTFFWWWKVQSPSGKIGWIPEGYDTRDLIFVRPAP